MTETYCFPIDQEFDSKVDSIKSLPFPSEKSMSQSLGQCCLEHTRDVIKPKLEAEMPIGPIMLVRMHDFGGCQGEGDQYRSRRLLTLSSQKGLPFFHVLFLIRFNSHVPAVFSHVSDSEHGK